jgi:hypothetical protein
VKDGEKLVILDDMVLNVTYFMYNHPGGKFALEQNIGRDVSKFFYGGYIMENYTGQGPHRHSNIARLQVNTIIVGRLATKAHVANTKIVERYPVNSFTQTILFRSDQTISGVMPYYSDIQMIGKHFLVRNIKKPRVKRQYTLCNCMKPELYLEYLRVLKEGYERGHANPIHEKHFEEKEGTDIFLTIKNYHFKKGLSTSIFSASQNDIFQIKGPMGAGLNL